MISSEKKTEEEEEDLVLLMDGEEDNEEDLFPDDETPREGFENLENDEDGEEDDEEEPSISISDTSEEDLAAYKMVIGGFDKTRAMAFSFFAVGDMSLTSKYIYYQDWEDPKHKAELEAGRIVAKKWKLSTFKNLPEFALLIAIVVSTGLLFTTAKKDRGLHKSKPKNKNTGGQERGREVSIHRPLTKSS